MRGNEAGVFTQAINSLLAQLTVQMNTLGKKTSYFNDQ